jgi:hypothetical protein
VKRTSQRASQEPVGPHPDGEVSAVGEQYVQVDLPWSGEVEITLERGGQRPPQARLLVPGLGGLEIRVGRSRFNVPDGTMIYCKLADSGARVRIAWRYESINAEPRP